MKDSRLRAPSPWIGRLSALADPVRLRILASLDGIDLAVSELEEILQLPQSTVSRHLRVLTDEGWVTARGERTANFYRLSSAELPEAARRLWETSFAEMNGWPALAHDRLRRDRALAARRVEARSFYAGVAAEWDRLRTELYGSRFTDEALLALLPRSWTVADLACGSGVVTERLARHVARVVAVDQSPEMLAAARRRTKGVANVELRHGDLEALPIDSRRCDAALLLLALAHVESPEKALREAARILRPAGRLVIVDLLRHDRDDFRRTMGQLRNGFDADELAGLIEGAGFVEVRVAPLPPQAEAKGPALLLAVATLPSGPRSRSRSRARGATTGRRRAKATAAPSPLPELFSLTRKRKRKDRHA